MRKTRKERRKEFFKGSVEVFFFFNYYSTLGLGIRWEVIIVGTDYISSTGKSIWI